MMKEPVVVQMEPEEQGSTHLVHALMQFALTVRYRKNVVIVSCLISFALGALYYATATRYYGAKAGLLISQSGSNLMATSVVNQGTQSLDLMPTHEKLVTRAKVAEGALKYLRPEHRVDMANQPREQWVAVIQECTSAKALRNTNIMEISCASKDPHAAVAMVNAVVQSYIDFLDQTHRGTAGEIIRVLTSERAKLAEELDAKEREVIQARKAFNDMGIRPEAKVLHPMVQRAIYFNEQLVETQRRRVELEASLAAIQTAIRNGDDLRQHVMTVANVVGREILLTSLGFSERDSLTQANLEKSLLDDRATLTTLQEHLGEAHPRVRATRDKIRMTESYLMSYRDRIDRRLAEIQQGQLASLLVQMVQQNLNEVWQQETSLQAEFERAEAEAVGLNGQLARLEIMEHDLGRLRNLHDVLLNRIATVDLRQEGAEVFIAVTHDPVVCETPISPKLKVVGILALLGGVIVGFGLVYVLDILDDRFRSVEEMQSQLRVPVLALIRQLEPLEGLGIDGLHVHVACDASENEAFRTLRTSLELAEHDTRRLVVSSAEPGDGKTTVLANLAACFAQSGKKTLLIDADLRRPGLTALMGMRSDEGLSGILRGADEVIRMAATYIQASGIEGLDVLPSGPRPANPAELLATRRFHDLLAWAETVYDQILVDSPPALATSDSAVIGRLVDGVVLVIQPDKNRRRMVLRSAEGFTSLKIPLIGVVANRIGSQKDRNYYGYNSGYSYEYGYGAERNEGDAAEPARDVAPPVPTASREPDSPDAVDRTIPRRVVQG